MYKYMPNKLKLIALLLVVVALLSTGLTQQHALAATLPPTTGTLSGTTRTFDLWAKPGTTALPGGATVNVWGYTDSAGGTVTSPGGPMLIANQGETVVVNLNNTLVETTSLLFQGQAMVPDTAGAAASIGTKTYTFTATTPGTFLYEAGLLPNAQHQAAMGLYGALIVRPATAGQAYDDPATAFNDEAVLVLGEIDPALNNSATPSTFDMRDYASKYFLINGEAYPATDPISSTAGNKILLRYVNAGIQHHSMALLGLQQNFVAEGGSLLPTLTHNVVAESLAPGQTGDAIASVPAAATTDSKFAVYDGNLMLHNNNAAGFGGMLTFVTAGTGTVDTGPTTSAVALTPNPTNGGVSVALSASIASANSTVAAAEYFIDATGVAGTGTAMGGTFGGSTAPVNATLSTADLALLASGTHTIYVHGQDATAKWGTFSSATLNLDKAGPVTSGLTLTPNPSNGTVSVALHATGNDNTTGGSNVAAAEYFIGAVGADGTGTPMTVNVAAPVASLDATISPPVTGGTVSVHSRDALGNWGPFATITLNVVAGGPVTSNVSAAKNPNNGALPLNSSSPVVRVTATMTSTGSNVSAAEGFIDTVGATGTGFPFIPSDGAFNSASEIGYADIPLTTINALSTGNHTIYVRGKNAAGNWGATGTVVLLIDKTAPTFTGISLAPNPTLGAATVTLTVNGATDPLVGGLASGIAGGEYWIGTTAPAPGGGTAFTGLTASIPVGALAPGTYTIGARVRDAAGNWSAGTSSATVLVVPDAIFSNGFDTGNAPWGWTSRSTNSTTRLDATNAAALVGTRGLQAQGNNTNYVQYNFGTTANPASPTYDARFYFRPNGNDSTGKDTLVAASGTGFTNAQTLFRVRYRLSGGVPQVQIQVGTGTANGAWANILGGTSNNVIEVVWQAVGSGGPNPGTLTLYVNGAVAQTLTTTSTASVGAVRMGSVTSTGTNAAMYFDAFASKRTVSPLIGP